MINNFCEYQRVEFKINLSSKNKCKYNFSVDDENITYKVMNQNLVIVYHLKKY